MMGVPWDNIAKGISTQVGVMICLVLLPVLSYIINILNIEYYIKNSKFLLPILVFWKKKEYSRFEEVEYEYRIDSNSSNAVSPCWVGSKINLNLNSNYFVNGKYTFRSGSRDSTLHDYKILGQIRHGTLTLTGVREQDTTQIITYVFPVLDDGALIVGVYLSSKNGTLCTGISILSEAPKKAVELNNRIEKIDFKQLIDCKNIQDLYINTI